MNATTNSPSMTVTLGRSTYGTPRPQTEVRFPRNTNHRQVSAAAHALAARAELATATTERWCVEMECRNDGALVWLELSEGSDAEAARGMNLLERLVQG
jgi:hypothetical protein